MNLNQLSIIGFLGKDAETKSLPNGTPVVKVQRRDQEVLEGQQQ